MPASFDRFLDNVEGEHQQAKQKRLIKCGLKQRLRFVFLAKVRLFADEDDFGDYERVDQRSAINEIRNVKLVWQEQAVGRDGAKKER
jgi:hypothetical protein